MVKLGTKQFRLEVLTVCRVGFAISRLGHYVLIAVNNDWEVHVSLGIVVLQLHCVIVTSEVQLHVLLNRQFLEMCSRGAFAFAFASASALGPVYTKRQRQHCDDACDSVLIENNRVAPEWSCNPFSSNSTVFNENRITSVIAALTLMLGVNGPLRLRMDIMDSQLCYSGRVTLAMMLKNGFQSHL